MYIYPSIFRAFGGEWFDGERVVVDSPEALAALEYYVKLLNAYAPAGVRMRVAQSEPIPEAETIPIAFDPAAVHLFDAETGRRVEAD